MNEQGAKGMGQRDLNAEFGLRPIGDIGPTPRREWGMRNKERRSWEGRKLRS